MPDKNLPAVPVLTPFQKVSVLLRSLPDDQCVEVLKNYPEADVEQICREMMNPPAVPEETRVQLLKEFNEQLGAATARPPAENIEGILARLYGVRRSGEILRRMKESAVRPPSLTGLIDAVGLAAAAEEMGRELPAVAAFALGELPAATAAKLLALLPDAFRAEVMIARVRSTKPRPEMADRVREGLRARLEERRRAAPPLDPGELAATAELVSQLPAETAKKIMDDLTQRDPVVGRRIADALFTFEDLTRLEDRDVQKILPRLNGVDLKMALRKCPAEISEKVFKNMSDRMSAALKEDIQNTPPQKKDVVEEAQRKIAVFIRDLVQKGEVTPQRAAAAKTDGAPTEELV